MSGMNAKLAGKMNTEISGGMEAKMTGGGGSLDLTPAGAALKGTLVQIN
jgi:hypothetical protein